MNQTAARTLLGYLNLSSGAADPRFYQSVNEAFCQAAANGSRQAVWLGLRDALGAELATLAGQTSWFESVDQAAAVLKLVFDRLLPAYREFHRDLLAHQSDEDLFQPFFIAKACRAVLRQGAPWSEEPRIVTGALDWINDFLGHRPVAVLRSAQKLEPYPHEWVCPIPLFVAGAGVADGLYHDLIAAVLEVLRSTDPGILDAAYFAPDLLAELALDPRAYDFDHPAHKRPNYHFGQWDPHTIDNAGNYCRFVVNRVTLDALLERVAQSPGEKNEMLSEAAVVLAGTMLMAAGVSGSGPDSHDSTNTLANLMPRIAAYRDEFYKRQLMRVSGEHGERLRAEAQSLRQAFGGARHDLNQRFARLRARQSQHVHLARLFAAIGDQEASSRQAHVVPVASARLLSEINGRITAGHLALARGDVAMAAKQFATVDEFLKRAIQCGAVADPWNILGFQGQFSLFPALENSVRDHRVDVLVHLVSQMLSLGVRISAEAAAAGADETLGHVRLRLDAIATWWDKFATLEVSGIESVSGRESVAAAEAVAMALTAWRQAGATGGDIAFWRKHVSSFASPRAYALVIETLLDKRDFLAAMGLLVQWLSESEQMPLVDGEYSFHRLTVRWLTVLVEFHGGGSAMVRNKSWSLVAKLFDYLEANAGEYWQSPRLAFAEERGDGSTEGDREDEEHRFEAAYEGVTYRDTTNDGIEGTTLSGGEPVTDYELELESARLRSRVAFLRSLARLRTIAATIGGASSASADTAAAAIESLAAQLPHAAEVERGLLELLSAVHRHDIPRPSGEHSALVEYDRRRRVKESILTDVAAATVETIASVRWMRAIVGDPASSRAAVDSGTTESRELESLVAPLLRAILESSAADVRRAFPALRARLEREPILFVPLARGGEPVQVVRTQSIKQMIVELLAVLPRLGLLAEACQLLATAIAMERHRPKGDRVVTEFDRLFDVGYRALVDSTIDAAAAGPQDITMGSPAASDAELFECLQMLTEPLLRLWLEHSRAVRLSVLEKVAEPDRWNALVVFIERYGRDLFTQRFLNLGSLRAIVDQGAEAYLRSLEEDIGASPEIALADDLGRDISRAAAAEHLQVIVEAVVENYAEYKEFNSTTTQSDHGELLYTLLDFLRLKAAYDRVCWNIRPIVTAHEILMRRGQVAAAELWRRAAAEQTGEAADAILKQSSLLAERYRMRLPSIDGRLAERFVRPLAVDGLRALVRPAIEEIRAGAIREACARLEQEIAEFAEQPVGSGMELPPWLAALDEEISREQMPYTGLESGAELGRPVTAVRMTLAEVARQVREWNEEVGE